MARSHNEFLFTRGTSFFPAAAPFAKADVEFLNSLHGITGHGFKQISRLIDGERRIISPRIRSLRKISLFISEGFEFIFVRFQRGLSMVSILRFDVIFAVCSRNMNFDFWKKDY